MTAARALALALCVAGCGGKGAIFLTIEARGPEGTLRVPEDVDQVVVKISPTTGGAALLEKDYPLMRDVHRFPLTLGLEQGGKTPNKVSIEIRALLAGAEVGTSVSTVPIDPESVTSVTLRIDTP